MLRSTIWANVPLVLSLCSSKAAQLICLILLAFLIVWLLFWCFLWHVLVSFFILSISFNISVPAEIKVFTLSRVTGIIGHSVTLTCNISVTYPSLISVTWEFNGTKIDKYSLGKYVGGSVTAPSLNITHLQTSDQGNYACSATNLFSSGHSYIHLNLTGEKIAHIHFF